jgi:hypothetical protein
MRNLLLVLAVLAMAAPAMARENVPWSGTPGTSSPLRTDVVLEYDGWETIGFASYGISPNWTDYTAVNFETPGGGPYCLAEAQYYVFGPAGMLCDVWTVNNLSAPPVTLAHTGLTFTPVAAAWPPMAFSIGDVSGYGAVYNSGDMFAVATDFAMFAGACGIGLADAYADGNPGHSWAIWSGAWTDDTYGYGYDDGIRAGLNQGISPVEQTTWGGVKNLYR